MLLIVEIILTVFAWRKGWRWLALLPVGIAHVAAFVSGLAIGASGGNIENSIGVFLIYDLLLIIAQVVMVRTPRQSRIQVSTKAGVPAEGAV